MNHWRRIGNISLRIEWEGEMVQLEEFGKCFNKHFMRWLGETSRGDRLQSLLVLPFLHHRVGQYCSEGIQQ